MQKFSQLSFDKFIINAFWLLLDYPHLQLNAAILWSSIKPVFFLQLAYTVGMMVIVFKLWVGFIKDRSSKWAGYIINGGILCVLFAVFHTILLVGSTQKWGVWYYGALFSLIYYIVFIFIIQFILEGNRDRIFKKFFVFFVIIAVIHGLAFSTFRIDIFDISNGSGYQYDDIFNGKTGQYYQDFSLSRHIERSECIKLYTRMTWAAKKEKDAGFITRQHIDRCKEMLSDDDRFRKDIVYLDIEL